MLLSQESKVQFLNDIIDLSIHVLIVSLVLQSSLIEFLLKALSLDSSVGEIVKLRELIVIDSSHSCVPQKLNELRSLLLALIDLRENFCFHLSILDLIAGCDLLVQNGINSRNLLKDSFVREGPLVLLQLLNVIEGLLIV